MSDYNKASNSNDDYEIISIRVPAKVSAMLEALSKINLEAKSSMLTRDISKFLYEIISTEKDIEIIALAEKVINDTPKERHENSFIELLCKNGMIYSTGNEK